MYPRNAVSPPRIALGAVIQISDGAVQITGVSIVVRAEGGSEIAGGGIIAYGTTSSIVYYTPTQAETNYIAFVVAAYKTGCIPISQTVITTASATSGAVVLSGETHTNAVIPTVSTLTGHTAQTGDAYAVVTDVIYGLAALETLVDELEGRLSATRAGYLDNLSGGAVALEGTLTSMKGATFDTLTDSLEALRDRGDSAWITATGFSTHSAADTWSVAVRVLTAGTNIVLAKGVGITGLNDLSAAQVNTECDTALTDYDAVVPADLPANFALLSIDGSGYVTEVNVDGIKKNTTLNNFEFLMVDATDGYTEETGLTVTAQRSIDGGAFGACVNSVTEVGNGIYKINLANTDLNGDVITLRFSATGARTRY